jgi:hypothetical protein
MNIDIENASRIFFQNSSLEMVFYEAVANSIDAGAKEIKIKVKIETLNKPATFSLEVIDDGEGFTAKNSEKFSKLLKPENDGHKGLGRLVFLRYFKGVDIESYYNGRKRSFTFDYKFKEAPDDEPAKQNIQKTTLTFNSYYKNKIAKHQYLIPENIKKSLLEHFYPLLYRKKVNNEPLIIDIGLEVKEPNPVYNFQNDIKRIDVSQIPDLTKITLPATGLDLFETLDFYYSIKEQEAEKTIITALCVDERTLPVDIISKGGIPVGYEIIFLLYSSLFNGKSNVSRQEIEIKEEDLKVIEKIFSDKVAEILNENLPQIKEYNGKTLEVLEDKFPHLSGYFDEAPVGLIEKNQSLEIAQKKFFNAQKEILNANSLTQEQYDKSLEISSRLLTEYILYRNLIIKTIKEIDVKTKEDEIHKLIVPKRRKMRGSEMHNDLFTNNAWLLDDKYMSYTTILSEYEMNDLLKEIAIPEDSRIEDNGRPDIAIIFSNDPATTEKVDVVIIELKKLDLKLAKKEEVVSQLKQRARNLANHFSTRIQRIWFYGIVDFDMEFIRSLKEEGYIELFSRDTVFYKEHNTLPDIKNLTYSVPTGLYVMSFEAFIRDAETRNATFLNVLKHQIKQLNPTATPV